MFFEDIHICQNNLINWLKSTFLAEPLLKTLALCLQKLYQMLNYQVNFVSKALEACLLVVKPNARGALVISVGFVGQKWILPFFT